MGTGIKKGASIPYRTASTACPCFVPDLGESGGSWSYRTCPAAKLAQIVQLVAESIPLCLLLFLILFNSYSQCVLTPACQLAMPACQSFWPNVRAGLSSICHRRPSTCDLKQWIVGHSLLIVHFSLFVFHFSFFTFHLVLPS